MSIVLLLCTIVVIIGSVATQCTLPSNLRGDWIRGRDKRTLNFNDTHVSGLDVVFDSATYSIFECFILEGTVVVVRSSNTYSAALSNDVTRLYSCWDLRQVDTTNYYMYERTNEDNANAGGARVKSYTEAQSATLTSSDVCDNQASAVPFFALVKSGAAFQQTCNDVIRGKYNYTYTSYGGSTSCGGDSLLDVCSDVSKPTFDYTKCSQQMMGSSGGVFSCLAAVTSGNYKFVLLYNEASDSAKFSCVIIDQQTDTTYMSYRPDYCEHSMTPNTAVSSGGTFVLKHLELCPYTTTAAQTTTTTSTTSGESANSSTGAIAGAVAAVAIVAIIAVIVGVVVYKKRQLRIKSTPQTPMNAEGGDKVANGNANSNGTAHANGNANGKTPDGQPQSDKVTSTSETNSNGDVPKEGNETPRPTRLPPLSNGAPLEGEAVSTPGRLPPISGT